MDRTEAGVRWDADLSDGCDTGWRSGELTVLSTGGASLSVGGGPSVAYDGPAGFDHIDGLILQGVAVGGTRTVSLANVVANFYAGDTAAVAGEVDYAGSDSASTDAQTPDAQAVIVNAPEGGAFKRVTVFCDVRLQSTDLPDWNELMARLYVYATPA